MANKILILGQSGTGKSTSIRNLNSEETYIIQSVKKDMPFKGWKNKYTEKNLSVVSDSNAICGYLKNISEKAPHIKTVIIDDFQYIMAIKFMAKVNETGYKKFTEIANDAFNVVMIPDNLRDDLTVVFFSHIEKTSMGDEKIKTIGNMLDEKIVVEGLFSTVLKSNCSEGKYFFETQNNGSNTVKSPMDMFEEREPNDLKVILEKIETYNN